MFAPFTPGQSWLHRLPPGVKLAALGLLGTGLFLIDAPAPMGFAAACALGLYPAVGLPLRRAGEQLQPVLLFGALIIAAQLFLNGPVEAFLVGARLVALLLLAGLVTLTTRTAQMIETLERALRPFAVLGINPRKAALALSLGVRFVPLLARITAEVREAQSVRGLDRNLIALAVPVLLRALKLTDEIANAIEARGFDPERPR